ncbi:uncharacterized protein LOC108196769 [Daucus carota subsp. sativus]|uniref:uncharacterized protein LOC108196769 n=1 Tax=Daucus carota subsp. sativus TaxID=79200 RepID=UPI0007EF1F2D|nr:PREDICTED: uncharacterized protein LOC108196769 [Daucus carota subsp. sativus]
MDEKNVHSPPVLEDEESVSCTKKLRFEGSPVYEDTGYTLFIDSGYKLPLYLSEFALGEFNYSKKTTFENVNVVETMKLLDIVKGTTYLITFEASLPDNKSDYAQTFETNIYMCPLDPTAKIEIKFVRIKPSDLDYDEKEYYGEKASESDEKKFEEKLSEFGEEDTERKLSESDKKGSDDKDSAEEKHSEFDGKDFAEEKLVESDEKHNKVNLFKSVKKDTEEELSKFDEKDSAEENVTESNMKPSEEEKPNKCDKEDHQLSQSDDKYQEGSESSKELKQYHIDVEKSDGFEVGYYPNVRGSCCMLHRYYDPPAKTVSTTCLNQLVYFSQLAICLYNMNMITCYDNVRVMKAMASGCGGTTYHITFEASLFNGNAVTFQTKLYASLPSPYHEIEVEFVRIKPVINSNITN